MHPARALLAALRRPLGVGLAVMVAALGLLALVPTVAFAASGDEITKFRADYVVEQSGVVKVTETISYRFGSGSGERHGIQRQLITREEYDNSQDAVYGYDDIRVSSPSGAPDQVQQEREQSNGGRRQSLVLKIGDPRRTLSSSTATYQISYDVTGAMRSYSDHDEFSWDATGFINTPQTNDVAITVTVPGGVLGGQSGAICFAGPAGKSSTTPCTSATVSKGVAQFTQSSLAPGDGLTIATQIRSGLVADNTPHLAPDASAPTPAQQSRRVAAGVVGGVVAVGSPLLGWWYWRRKGRDFRYVGLPPGTLPRRGEPVEVGYDKGVEIPVAFTPPRIPVAEAGLLVDGQLETRETAATIIDLAVRGALTVDPKDEKHYTLTLVDPSRTQAPHEASLLTALFGGGGPGTVADLSARGTIVPAHQALVRDVRRQVLDRGWFRSLPGVRGTAHLGVGAIVIAAIILFQAASSALWWLILFLAPAVITIAVVHRKLRRGQRTADGRAVCDQVEGFRRYLATAEADQLRFEEGEDIFSRYLPWAIAFDLADRWARICAQLVAAGRLPDTTPYWYTGNLNFAAFNIGFLASSLSTAATPMPSTGGSGSGAGFGGGSSFGGGGFAGIGGGGGGTSSW